jgi:hypothetical protein
VRQPSKGSHRPRGRNRAALRLTRAGNRAPHTGCAFADGTGHLPRPDRTRAACQQQDARRELGCPPGLFADCCQASAAVGRRQSPPPAA